MCWLQSTLPVKVSLTTRNRLHDGQQQLFFFLYNPLSVITCTRCKEARDVTVSSISFPRLTAGLTRPKPFLIHNMFLSLLTYFFKSLQDIYSSFKLLFQVKPFLIYGLKFASLRSKSEAVLVLLPVNRETIYSISFSKLLEMTTICLYAVWIWIGCFFLVLPEESSFPDL